MTKKSKTPQNVTNSTVRNTGLIVAGVLGAYELLKTGKIYGFAHPKLVWVVAILTILSLIAPILLKPIYHLWMKIGEGLGFVMSRLLLGILFYSVILPISMIQKLFGSTEIKKHFDKAANSYRILKKPISAKHMDNISEINLEG